MVLPSFHPSSLPPTSLILSHPLFCHPHLVVRSILKTFEVLFWSLFGMLQTSERELRQPPDQFEENDPWQEGVMGPNKLGVWMISGSLEIILGAWLVCGGLWRDGTQQARSLDDLRIARNHSRCMGGLW